MGKQKHEISEPAEAASVSTETAAPGLAFDLGTWKGLPQWRCRLCPFDTVAGEGAMRAHIEKVHEPPRAQAQRPLVAVFDRYGREVRPAVAAPPGPAESES
jgi:hypothetical protein